MACANSSKNYYLELGINNETQSPRRLIKSFDFMRKDVSSDLKGQVKITSSVRAGTSQPAGLTLTNTITEKTTSTSFRLENEIGKFIAISMGSNKTSFGGIAGSQGTISYSGGNVFSFSALNTPASWLWRNTYAPSLSAVFFDKLMELTPNGSLILYRGNLNVNGSINATQNISASYFRGDGSQLTNLPTGKVYTHLSNFTNDVAFINSTQAQVYNDTLLITGINATLEINKVPYTGAINNLNLGNFNVTANSGFFSYLGSLANRVTKLWVQDIDASGDITVSSGNLIITGNINGTGNIITSKNITSNYATVITGLFTNLNTTNITAAQYKSVDNGESKTGLTSSKFRVCSKFKVPQNSCEEWCKLEIIGGIITDCK